MGWVYPSPILPYGDAHLDQTVTPKAEQRAAPNATQANTLDDRNGLLRTLMNSARQRRLDTQRDSHRGRPSHAALPADDTLAPDPAAPQNRRHGHAPKTRRGEVGPRTLDTPRDRHGTFPPPLLAKPQRRRPGLEEKILARYAKGRTPRDIQDVVKQLDGVALSPTLVSASTADRDAEGTAGRQRRRQAVWPLVSLDGLVVHVRGENGRVTQPTMAVALAVNLRGKKELWGLWLSEAEGATFWWSGLTDRKDRGVQDIFLVSVEGRTGFPEAIRTAYPHTNVQRSMVPGVRAALG